jgi:hypothetical protein
MRYVIDLFRDVVYTGHPAEYRQLVLLNPLANLVIVAAMFAVFMALGTALFVRRETNR